MVDRNIPIIYRHLPFLKPSNIVRALRVACVYLHWTSKMILKSKRYKYFSEFENKVNLFDATVLIVRNETLTKIAARAILLLVYVLLVTSLSLSVLYTT